MIDGENLHRLSRIMPRLYVSTFLAGGYLGLTETNIILWEMWRSTTILETFAFPAYGILFGMLWMGVGPLIALFFTGIKDGIALKLHFLDGGGPGAQLFDIGLGLLESMSLLYAATGGMYLAVYISENYRNGMVVDETQKINFIRKAAVSILLAGAVIGLRLAYLGR